MPAATRKVIHQPVARAHCGECDHQLLTDERHMWCINNHCKQFAEKFLAQRGVVARPLPQTEAA